MSLPLILLASPAMAAQVTVEKGDTLWSIANKNGTTVDVLQNLNNLSSTNLQPGMILELPEQAANQQSFRTLTEEQRQEQELASRGIVDRAQAVLEYAKEYIGVRYRSGGDTPAGFDCSGYVKYVFKNFGIDLVHTAAGQYNSGTIIKKEELQPGDLVFFNTGGNGINHSGIYIGDNKFIHSSSSRGIRIDSMNDNYWGPRYRGANKIL
ncbi:C40 family peptidase [Desulforamulus aquiferis]|uniref:Peptidoglycan endopeptidase n=1 Tax=Desulforamulus aquiferis TaxID=1397668 RepID=A0AAW7ZAL4_9FIRM|nr:LysM peptidoglycan-binding domain-containing C40 family peptidase [Desulforamulus aquiferis]MDO7786367.1 peptidoglycan endopeptidase [Desulforamulus aquiferis]